MFGFPTEYIQYCFQWAKKALLVIVTFFIVFQLFAFFLKHDNPQQAQIDTRTHLRNNITATINYLDKQSENGKELSQAFQGSMCFFTGEACKGSSSSSGGMTGFMANSIAWPLSNPPSSGIVVVKNTLEKAGFIPKSYAAGIEGVGFASLAPFREIWLVFRNLIFVLMVLVVIIIGFMIMFRAKINPQTVISIENALPKIVVALLLVTFSYAIAGFMIDLMYIVMGLLGALFQQIPSASTIHIEDYIYGKGPNGIFDALNFTSTGEIASALHNLLPATLKNTLDMIVQGLLSLGVFKITDKIVPLQKNRVFANKNFAKEFQTLSKTMEQAKAYESASKNVGGTGGGLGWVSLGAMLVFLGLQTATNLFFNSVEVIFFINFILMLTLLMVWFRLFFMLINTYVQILLLVLFSPFFMVAEAIPGRSGFGTWMKNMVYHLMTYPLFVGIILIGNIITNSTGETNSLILWQPPFLGGLDAHTFSVVVAGVLIFSAPNIIKMIKEMTGIKPISAGQGVGPGTFFAGAGALLSVGQSGIAGSRTLLQNMPGLRRSLVGSYDASGTFNKGMLGHTIGNFFWGDQQKYYSKEADKAHAQSMSRATGGQTPAPPDNTSNPPNTVKT